MGGPMLAMVACGLIPPWRRPVKALVRTGRDNFPRPLELPPLGTESPLLSSVSRRLSALERNVFRRHESLRSCEQGRPETENLPFRVILLLRPGLTVAHLALPRFWSPTLAVRPLNVWCGPVSGLCTWPAVDDQQAWVHCWVCLLHCAGDCSAVRLRL